MALQDGFGDAGNANDGSLENSHLTYIIPFGTKFNPEEAFRGGEGSFESKLASIELREQLFFGMRFANCSHPSVSSCSFADCR
jgi:hypothetical protein